MTERAFKGILILLALVGLMLAFQGRSWAGIYVAYDSNPMVVFDGADCAGGVTEALRNNPGARIVFESVGGGTAESTIGTWSGAASGVSECIGDIEFDNAGFWAESVGWAQAGGIETATNSSLYLQTVAVQTTTYKKMYRLGVTGNAYTSGTYYLFISGANVKSGAFSTGGDKVTYLTCTYTSGGGTSGVTGENLTASFKAFSQQEISSPGPNGCLLGPVTVRGGFNANAITKFRILRPVSPREQRRHRTGPWRVVWDSAVN